MLPKGWLLDLLAKVIGSLVPLVHPECCGERWTNLVVTRNDDGCHRKHPFDERHLLRVVGHQPRGIIVGVPAAHLKDVIHDQAELRKEYDHDFPHWQPEVHVHVVGCVFLVLPHFVHEVIAGFLRGRKKEVILAHLFKMLQHRGVVNLGEFLASELFHQVFGTKIYNDFVKEQKDAAQYESIGIRSCVSGAPCFAIVYLQDNDRLAEDPEHAQAALGEVELQVH
mmetsp:Transcript_62748/g.173941  ORF Transcript_62748/g.173941 Transcript_62748/m.173941 type:complete len:224 (-) Transcript_62748:207-878(-)